MILDFISDPIFIITFVSALPSSVLGLIVILGGKRGVSARLFFIASITIAIWAIANFFSLTASENTLFWIRQVIFSATFLMLVFFLLAKSFGSVKIRLKRVYVIGSILLTLVTMAAVQTPLVFARLHFIGTQPIPEPGPLIPLFGLTVLFFFTATVVDLIRRLRSRVGVLRRQYIYFSAGYFLMFALLIVTQFLFTVLFDKTSFVKYGPLFTLPFLISTTYALLRHHLFNVKVIATELFVGILSAIFLINVFTSVSLSSFWLNIALLVLFTFFGALLIRSVLKEVRLREEVARLADSLRIANKRLKKLDEAKTEFLSIASHQLRSPMTGIKGYMSMLIEGDFGRVSEKQKKVMSNMMINTDSLIQLVNLFLDVTRIEEGRFELVPSETDFAQLIQDSMTPLMPQAKAKGLKINFNRPRLLPKIEVDRDKTKQVIVNLIDNAIKYTPKGEIVISLRLMSNVVVPPAGAAYHVSRGKIKGKRILLCVADTGIGLDQSDIDQLYQKFFRVKGTAQVYTGGSGLGLFVVKKIVELHSGDLAVWSNGKGKGATFCVAFSVKNTG
jgi:signal transduction histidine kinase